MKRIKITFIFCSLLLFATGCKKGGVFCYQPDGNVVTQEREHTDFSKISLEMAADLYVTQGDEYSVSIEASNNLMEIIETKVSGTTLEIDLKKGKCIKNNYDVKVYITLPELKDLSISGSGDVFIPNKMTSDDLELDISGSGSLEIDSLFVNHVEMVISGSGDVMLTAMDTIETETIDISGSGEVRAFNVPSKTVEIRVSGSGECEVYAIDRLDVNISGSGDVTYKGNPIIDQRISGSGSIKPY
ncbi:MAG: hypothetical protein GQ574_15555 [Crocinitomix sp.]|nr:hypothetical protein [Crocinitomix sp.]